jgi:hypothetical protein
MAAVATGGPRIQDRQHEYQIRRREIAARAASAGADRPESARRFVGVVWPLGRKPARLRVTTGLHL